MVLAVGLVGASLVLAAGPQLVLVVTTDGGEELYSASVAEGDAVVLEYTHSVENSTVRDGYVVHEDGLAFAWMEFSSFGAGLPSEADVERTDDGLFRHEVPGNEPGQVRISTGEIAGHELIVDGERVDLVGLADGGNVVLQIQTAPRIPIR